jgi:predicted nucleic acid-binding protein
VSRYLLDTDVLIDYARGREPATSRIGELLTRGEELGVCAVNVAEFFAGLPPADRPYWRTVLGTLAYWPVTFAAALRAGELRRDYARRGLALATTDTLIAAVALEHGATLVTRNAKHYPEEGLELLTLTSD